MLYKTIDRNGIKPNNVGAGSVFMMRNYQHHIKIPTTSSYYYQPVTVVILVVALEVKYVKQSYSLS